MSIVNLYLNSIALENKKFRHDRSIQCMLSMLILTECDLNSKVIRDVLS